MKYHINVQNLNTFYSDHQALKNITIEIPEKQITAIIGPSGCGKSTFLKCFNRLIDLTDGARVSGKIIVDGIDVLDRSVDITEVRRRMGLLPQKPNHLHCHLRAFSEVHIHQPFWWEAHPVRVYITLNPPVFELKIILLHHSFPKRVTLKTFSVGMMNTTMSQKKAKNLSTLL